MDMIESFKGEMAEQDVAAFEREIQCELPASYRTFLLTHNGGEPRIGYFKVPGWGPSAINYFYGLKLGKSQDIRRAMEQVSDVEACSACIPIARDPGGNRVCLGIKTENAGRILFWDHEAYDEPLIELAPNFDAFVASLSETEQP